MEPSRLRPEVLAAKHGSLRLGDDLARFARVLEVEAPEAAALYAGRILEVLAAAQVRALSRTPSGNIYGNLVELSELGTIGELTGRLAHALRRLANEARHANRVLGPDDAALAEVLLERLLTWHFTRFPLGPRLPGLYVAAPTLPQHPLARFVSAIERDPAAARSAWTAELERSSFASTLLAEALIARGNVDDLAAAEACVSAARSRDPADLALRQLDAWMTRLRGDLDGAIRKLEVLYEESEDVETTGLLAGSYKRRWIARPQGEVLKRAADLYHRAWKRGDRRSAYVGVNAASMALLDGQPGRAQQIARVIETSYEQRRGLLAPGRTIAFTGYWDLVTYAEVKLLLGDRDEAAHTYHQACHRYADHRAFIASTRTQLALLLPALDLAPAFLETAMPTYSPRPLPPDTTAVPGDVRELCERLAEQVHERWSAMRIVEGWRHGLARDDDKKEHPCLVPYDQLPESEKDIDRATVDTVVGAILAMGFEIRRP